MLRTTNEQTDYGDIHTETPKQFLWRHCMGQDVTDGPISRIQHLTLLAGARRFYRIVTEWPCNFAQRLQRKLARFPLDQVHIKKEKYHPVWQVSARLGTKAQAPSERRLKAFVRESALSLGCDLGPTDVSVSISGLRIRVGLVITKPPLKRSSIDPVRRDETHPN